MICLMPAPPAIRPIATFVSEAARRSIRPIQQTRRTVACRDRTQRADHRGSLQCSDECCPAFIQIDTMADDGKEAPAQPKKDKGSLSRTVLPYIVAAALASAVMAWYFFIFVPGKLDYFVGLKFRTLAVAGGHVGSKIQSLERAIRSVPGMTDSTCSARVVDPKQPTVASRYVALVLPEIRLQGTGAGASGLLLTCGISGTVAWSDIAAVAAAASRRDFDDLVLADESGNVVWQREATTPRVGNVTELLGATDDAGGWLSLSWRERATLHVQQDKKYLRSTAVLKTLNLAGRPSLFSFRPSPSHRRTCLRPRITLGHWRRGRCTSADWHRARRCSVRRCACPRPGWSSLRCRSCCCSCRFRSSSCER